MKQSIFNSLQLGDRIFSLATGIATISKIFRPGSYEVTYRVITYKIGEFESRTTYAASSENWTQAEPDEYRALRVALSEGKNLEVREKNGWRLSFANYEGNPWTVIFFSPASDYRVVTQYNQYADALDAGKIVQGFHFMSSKWKFIERGSPLYLFLTGKETSNYGYTQFRILVDPYQEFRDAEKAGKKVQCRLSGDFSWGKPLKNWSYILPVECYRIAPEPQIARVAVQFRENASPLTQILSKDASCPIGWYEVTVKQNIELGY